MLWSGSSPLSALRDGMWGFLLLAGVAWLAVAWSVLRLEPADIADVAGPVVLFAAVTEIVRALAGTRTWWLNAGMAVLFAATGALLISDRGDSWTTPAALIGWYLMVRGAADIAISMMTREIRPDLGPAHGGRSRRARPGILRRRLLLAYGGDGGRHPRRSGLDPGRRRPGGVPAAARGLGVGACRSGAGASRGAGHRGGRLLGGPDRLRGGSGAGGPGAAPRRTALRLAAGMTTCPAPGRDPTRVRPQRTSPASRARRHRPRRPASTTRCCGPPPTWTRCWRWPESPARPSAARPHRPPRRSRSRCRTPPRAPNCPAPGGTRGAGGARGAEQGQIGRGTGAEHSADGPAWAASTAGPAHTETASWTPQHRRSRHTERRADTRQCRTRAPTASWQQPRNQSRTNAGRQHPATPRRRTPRAPSGPPANAGQQLRAPANAGRSFGTPANAGSGFGTQTSSTADQRTADHRGLPASGRPAGRGWQQPGDDASVPLLDPAARAARPATPGMDDTSIITRRLMD